MSSIKQAAAVVLQRRYREHLDRRAAGILAEIDTRMHEFRRLPTTRLDGAAATVGLHMSVADLSAIIGPIEWMSPAPSPRVAATPFARTSGMPRVVGMPPPTTTGARANVLALVDEMHTASVLEATLLQAAPASTLQAVVVANGLPEPVSPTSKLGQALKWFKHSPEPRLLVVSLHGVTSDRDSFVVVPVKAKRHPSALVSVHELLTWLDAVAGPARVHLDCCFGTLHQGAGDDAAMTAFTAFNGSVVTGYSYAAEASSSMILVPHAIAAAAANDQCPSVYFTDDFD